MTIDVRCPKCNRLLFKAEGTGSRVETKCPGCKAIVIWPSEKAEVLKEKPNRTLVQE